ncbi:MAG: TatD family hydrolase, partial [Bacteroidia bacterium]|nr:TatD family hydrolase [Bacteroidia bacterium]
FKDDIDETIERAKAVGVSKVLLPNIDTASIESLNNLVKKDSDFFYRMMGLHPCSVKEDYMNELERIQLELDSKSCVAVGEIGIDLYWDKSTKEIQEKAFITQCNWAIERNLPVVIHSRESIDLIIDIIKEHFAGRLKGVFHCFTGSLEQAQEIESLGFYMGIGGVVTFKNSNLREVLPQVSLEKIIVETDSPYLAPVPYRGKRNESSYVVEVVKELAKTYNVSESDISKITTENALSLFNL